MLMICHCIIRVIRVIVFLIRVIIFKMRVITKSIHHQHIYTTL